MKRFTFVAAVVFMVTLGVSALPGGARDRKANTLKANLIGFDEVPSISSTGTGELQIRIATDESSFDFELSMMALRERLPRHRTSTWASRLSLEASVCFYAEGAADRPVLLHREPSQGRSLQPMLWVPQDKESQQANSQSC